MPCYALFVCHMCRNVICASPSQRSFSKTDTLKVMTTSDWKVLRLTWDLCLDPSLPRLLVHLGHPGAGGHCCPGLAAPPKAGKSFMTTVPHPLLLRTSPMVSDRGIIQPARASPLLP